MSNEMLSLLTYFGVAALFSFDSGINLFQNFDGEVEDGIFTHRFIPLSRTYTGNAVNATYHAVECGSLHSEPIVFGHGLAENWRVWKDIMLEFCATHRVIAYDSEGMGQSDWPDVEGDISRSGARSFQFMADMQLQMLKQLGVSKFNLVVTDYSFWSTLWIVSLGSDVIMRYGKFQSVSFA